MRGKWQVPDLGNTVPVLGNVDDKRVPHTAASTRCGDRPRRGTDNQSTCGTRNKSVRNVETCVSSSAVAFNVANGEFFLQFDSAPILGSGEFFSS